MVNTDITQIKQTKDYDIYVFKIVLRKYVVFFNDVADTHIVHLSLKKLYKKRVDYTTK